MVGQWLEPNSYQIGIPKGISKPCPNSQVYRENMGKPPTTWRCIMKTENSPQSGPANRWKSNNETWITTNYQQLIIKSLIYWQFIHFCDYAFSTCVAKCWKPPTDTHRQAAFHRPSVCLCRPCHLCRPSHLLRGACRNGALQLLSATSFHGGGKLVTTCCHLNAYLFAYEAWSKVTSLRSALKTYQLLSRVLPIALDQLVASGATPIC